MAEPPLIGASKVTRLPVKVKRPGPPRSLRTRQARNLWREVVKLYEVEAHHLALLEAACVAVDRQVDARAQIERDGAVIAGQRGVLKQHPAVAIERDSRIGMCRALRELGLDAEQPSERSPGRSYGS
jgi:P27 family predicted phage terminase small subunit